MADLEQVVLVMSGVNQVTMGVDEFAMGINMLG
jgi:hypothetical protein